MSDNPTQTILEILAREARVAATDIQETSDLVGELGIDSPKALQVLVEIEDRLDIEIADEDVAGLRTVGDILAAVASRFPTAESG